MSKKILIPKPCPDGIDGCLVIHGYDEIIVPDKKGK